MVGFAEYQLVLSDINMNERGVKPSMRSPALQRSSKHLEYDKSHTQGKTTPGYCTKCVTMEHRGNQGVSTWAGAKQGTSASLSEGLREENMKSF